MLKTTDTFSAGSSYGADGLMSAQLMRRDRQAFASASWPGGTPEEIIGAYTSYLAYAGKYEVNEEGQQVIHIPTVALFPNWIGVRQVRNVSLSHDKLTLRTPELVSPSGHRLVSALEWERIPRP